VTPVIYTYLDDLQQRVAGASLRNLFRRRQPEPHAAPAD